MSLGLFCSPQCLDSTNGKIKVKDGLTLPVEHQVQKEYTGKEMAFCHSPPLFQLPARNTAFLFKPYSQLTSASLLILCPEVITMATWVLAGAGPSCDISKGSALASPQSPSAWADQSTRGLFLSAHHVVPQIVPVHFHGCYLCLRLNAYYSERESGRNPREDALQRALFNSAESTRACLRPA